MKYALKAMFIVMMSLLTSALFMFLLVGTIVYALNAAFSGPKYSQENTSTPFPDHDGLRVRDESLKL